MIMISIRSAFKCAKTDLIKWAFNSRMIVLAVLAVFIYVCAVQPLTENSALMEEPLNMLEPYIAALNSGSLLLIIPLGFLAISSDFPKIDGSAMFGLVRTGRINWFCGQLINLSLMSMAYLVFIFAASVLPAVYCSYWGTDWSEVVLYFRLKFPEQAQNFGALLLPKNLFNHMPLTGAAAQSTLFVFLYLITLGMIMMCFTVLGKKTAGVIVCGGVITVGSALCSINSQLMWALPMANSIVWLHYTEFRREPFYPIWCSGIYFAIVIAFFIFVSLMRLKSFDCSANNAEER